MRVSKPPEVRRQEIMDIAMKVFLEKGYEQTTMRDIAAAVGVVPGLCYRYFASKQELFDTVISQYISEYCAPMIHILKDNTTCFEEMVNKIPDFFSQQNCEGKYHSFFHKPENINFHIILSNGICEYMLPYIKEFVDRENEKGNINIEDTESFSRFALYGQCAILNDKSLTDEEKAKWIKEYILKLIR